MILKTSIFLTLLCSSIFACQDYLIEPGKVESVTIYYDGFMKVYRSGNTCDKIKKQHDLKIVISKSRMLQEIKMPNHLYCKWDTSSRDIRLRADFKMDTGQKFTVCFNRHRKYMYLNGTNLFQFNYQIYETILDLVPGKALLEIREWQSTE